MIAAWIFRSPLQRTRWSGMKIEPCLKFLLEASAHSNYWKVIWRLAVPFYALNDDRMACSGKTARSSPFLAFFLVCWLIHFVSHGWAPLPKQSHWVNDMGSSVWGVQWSDNQKRQLSEPHPKHLSHPQLTCYCLSRACLCPIFMWQHWPLVVASGIVEKSRQHTAGDGHCLSLLLSNTEFDGR